MPKFQINRRTVLKTGLATAATLAMPPILRAADQVKIGFLAPLTGSEAILGIVQLQCYQLAIDHLNAAGGIGGREIVPQVILEPDPACAVVFVPRTASRRAYLRAAEGLPVLTVGESPDFLELGGIINFVTEGSEVRFQVDTERARRHKLTISSRLLSLSLADVRDSR